ncbi:hypothetical protein D047_0662B, partial [Vibrio parahaemolyticus VPTS-2010_2]
SLESSLEDRISQKRTLENHVG